MQVDNQVEFLFHRGLVRSSGNTRKKTDRHRNYQSLIPSAHKWIVRMEGGPQRVNHAAVQVGNNIFSFGGFCTGEDYVIPRPIDVFVLNVDSLKWQSIRNFEDFTDDMPFQRYGHTVFSYGKCVYLFGGRNDKGACNMLYQLDTEKLKWKRIQTTGTIPGARDGHSSCCIGNMVYIFGGFEEVAHCFSNDVYALNLDTFVWRYVECRGAPPTHRDFHSACAIGTDMYIFGGRGNMEGPFHAERDTYCNHLARFNTLTSEWSYPEQRGDIPSGRRSHSCFVYRDEMYIFGGFNSTKRKHYGDMFCYNPRDMTWREVPVNVGRVGPPCPRRRHTSIMVGDRLYVFGGTSPKSVPISPAFANMNHEVLVDHNDLYILDFKPTLKTLSLGTVIEEKLNLHQLPTSLQEQISMMISHEPRPRRLDNAG